MGDGCHSTHGSSCDIQSPQHVVAENFTMHPSLTHIHPELLEAFTGTALVRHYEKGETVYRRGQPARGVFLIQKGRVRFLLAGPGGDRLALHSAGPKAVLALGETMSGRPYEATAEVLEPAEVSFIRRDDLLSYLREHRNLCLQIVQLLSEDLHTLYEQYRTVGGPATRAKRGATSGRAVTDKSWRRFAP